MFTLIISGFMMALAQDEIVLTTSEPRRPETSSISAEFHCGDRKVVLSGVSGSGPGFDTPSITLDGRKADMPLDMQDFLLEDRAAYRVSATCPSAGPTFQIKVYRAARSLNGQVSYDIRAMDVSGNGAVIDRGSETSTAEAFWYR